MSYCTNCIHYKVCGNEGVDDSAMTFCADKQTDEDLISKSVLDQIRWERDIAISQLQDLGYDLGEKPRTDGDLISRQAVKDLIRGLTRWCVRSQDGKFNNVGLLYDDVMFGIDRLQSAEKTAEWRIVGKTTLHYECSKCGGAGDKWDKFCKHCGADMRGE